MTGMLARLLELSGRAGQPEPVNLTGGLTAAGPLSEAENEGDPNLESREVDRVDRFDRRFRRDSNGLLERRGQFAIGCWYTGGGDPAHPGDEGGTALHGRFGGVPRGGDRHGR